jgi:TPR repeat protein
MNKTLVLVAIGLLMTGPARAVDESNLEALRAEAARGDAASQYEMGVLYEFGFNLPDNLPPALAWYMAAAEQGNERAIKRRDLLQGQLSSAQIDEARRLRAELAAAPPRPASPPAAEPAAPEAPTAPAPEPKPDEPK